MVMVMGFITSIMYVPFFDFRRTRDAQPLCNIYTRTQGGGKEETVLLAAPRDKGLYENE